MSAWERRTWIVILLVWGLSVEFRLWHTARAVTTIARVVGRGNPAAGDW